MDTPPCSQLPCFMDCHEFQMLLPVRRRNWACGSNLDDRLRALRIVGLQQVRVLWQKSEQTLLAQGKLNTKQRKKQKLAREAAAACA